MNANARMHILLMDEDYAATSWATNACEAVQHHYDELDMYCPPSSEIDTEEALVTVFSIPPALEDRLADEFEEMESDAMAEAILRLVAKHPEITKATVKFSYKSGDLQVFPVEPTPAQHPLFVTDDA